METEKAISALEAQAAIDKKECEDLLTAIVQAPGFKPVWCMTATAFHGFLVAAAKEHGRTLGKWATTQRGLPAALRTHRREFRERFGLRQGDSGYRPGGGRGRRYLLGGRDWGSKEVQDRQWAARRQAEREGRKDWWIAIDCDENGHAVCAKVLR